jgi:hypothetical protein
MTIFGAMTPEQPGCAEMDAARDEVHRPVEDVRPRH